MSYDTSIMDILHIIRNIKPYLPNYFFEESLKRDMSYARFFNYMSNLNKSFDYWVCGYNGFNGFRFFCSD